MSSLKTQLVHAQPRWRARPRRRRARRAARAGPAPCRPRRTARAGPGRRRRRRAGPRPGCSDELLALGRHVPSRAEQHVDDLVPAVAQALGAPTRPSASETSCSDERPPPRTATLTASSRPPSVVVGVVGPPSSPVRARGAGVELADRDRHLRPLLGLAARGVLVEHDAVAAPGVSTTPLRRDDLEAGAGERAAVASSWVSPVTSGTVDLGRAPWPPSGRPPRPWRPLVPAPGPGSSTVPGSWSADSCCVTSPRRSRRSSQRRARVVLRSCRRRPARATCCGPVETIERRRCRRPWPGVPCAGFGRVDPARRAPCRSDSLVAAHLEARPSRSAPRADSSRQALHVGHRPAARARRRPSGVTVEPFVGLLAARRVLADARCPCAFVGRAGSTFDLEAGGACSAVAADAWSAADDVGHRPSGPCASAASAPTMSGHDEQRRAAHSHHQRASGRGSGSSGTAAERAVVGARRDRAAASAGGASAVTGAARPARSARRPRAPR